MTLAYHLLTLRTARRRYSYGRRLTGYLLTRTPPGRQIELDEVAYQEWRDGKIIRERFYYDPAQRLRGV